jgi:hypothetical protein
MHLRQNPTLSAKISLLFSFSSERRVSRVLLAELRIAAHEQVLTGILDQPTNRRLRSGGSAYFSRSPKDWIEFRLGSYALVHQTIVTPRQTMAIPIQRFRLMRSPRKSFAPKAPAA